MKKTLLIFVILCLACALVFSAAGCNDILSVFAVSDAPADYTLEDVFDALDDTKTFDTDIFLTYAVTLDEVTYTLNSALNFTVDNVDGKDIIYMYSIPSYPSSVCYLIDSKLLKLEDGAVVDATMSDLYPQPSYLTGDGEATEDTPDIGSVYFTTEVMELLELDFLSMAYEIIEAPAGSMAFQITLSGAMLDAIGAVLDEEDGSFADISECTFTITADNATRLPESMEMTFAGTANGESGDTTVSFAYSMYFKILFKSYDEEQPVQYPAEILAYIEGLE